MDEVGKINDRYFYVRSRRNTNNPISIDLTKYKSAMIFVSSQPDESNKIVGGVYAYSSDFSNSPVRKSISTLCENNSDVPGEHLTVSMSQGVLTVKNGNYTASITVYILIGNY